MKLRRKICCQETASISSVNPNEQQKYALDDLNSTVMKQVLYRYSLGTHSQPYRGHFLASIKRESDKF